MLTIALAKSSCNINPETLRYIFDPRNAPEKAIVARVKHFMDGNVPKESFQQWCDEITQGLKETEHPAIKEMHKILDRMCYKTNTITANESMAIINNISDGVRVYYPRFSISTINASYLAWSAPAWMFKPDNNK